MGSRVGTLGSQHAQSRTFVGPFGALARDLDWGWLLRGLLNSIVWPMLDILCSGETLPVDT
jgi:hypothetical protein